MALDWFEKDGHKCTEYGVHVSSLPPVTVAKERLTFETVAGRSGSITMAEGDCVYDDITLDIECWISDMTSFSEFVAWIIGPGQFRFPNRPGGYYNGRLNNQIELSRIVAARAHREFTLTLRCEPFFYFDPVSPVTITESGQTIKNPGNVPSLPRLEIAGSGTFSIMFGTQRMLFTGVSDGGIIVDSVLQDALTYDNAVLANNKVSGDFFQLKPGTNTIQWLCGGEGLDGEEAPGSIASIKITPRWRSL